MYSSLTGGLFSLLVWATRRVAGKGWGLGRRIPGLLSLYEWLYTKLTPPHAVELEIRGLRLKLHPHDRVLTKSLLMRGVYEAQETALFQTLIGRGAVVVDVGANVGLYTLLAARSVGSNGAVFAFEPEPATFQLLTKNVCLNGFGNVIAIEKAVADRAGYAKLFLDAQNPGLPSLRHANVASPSGEVRVATVALDDFFERYGGPVQVIKVDAQGAEGLVIGGARRLLQEYGPYLLMEFWPHGLQNVGTVPAQLLDDLESLGYAAFAIERTHTSMTATEILHLCQQVGAVNLLFSQKTCRTSRSAIGYRRTWGGVG